MTSRDLLAPLRLPRKLQTTDLDDPDNIFIIRSIIRRKPVLTNVYRSFDCDLLERIKTIPESDVIELGSGASFLKQVVPFIVTSDILLYKGVDRVFSGLKMPFPNQSVSAFLMIDVCSTIHQRISTIPNLFYDGSYAFTLSVQRWIVFEATFTFLYLSIVQGVEGFLTPLNRYPTLIQEKEGAPSFLHNSFFKAALSMFMTIELEKTADG